MDIAPVVRRPAQNDEFLAQQGLDEVARGGLVNVHAPRDAPHADARMIADQTKRPDLRPTQSDLLFNLPELTSNSVEHNPEATQHLRRSDRIFGNRIHRGEDQKKEPRRAPNSSG